jgi:hypothetical protein
MELGPLANLIETIARIERKLDLMIEALAAEDDNTDQLQLTLDGDPMPGERDQSQPL